MEDIDYANLAEWIKKRLLPFHESKMLLDQYCARSGDDFAQLDSCIQLSHLSSEQIDAVGKARISPACWHTMVTLADESPAMFDAGIKIANGHKRGGLLKGESPLVIKLRAVLGRKNKATVTPSDLKAAAAMARKYSALPEDEAKVFESMARYLGRSGSLTPRQLAFMGSLLGKMRSARVNGSTTSEKEVLGRLYSMIG